MGRNVILSGIVALLVTSFFAQTVAAQQEFPYIGKVSGDSVNVRSKASSDNNVSKIIVSVPKGTEVTVVGEENGFLKIAAPAGTPCWVSERLVKKLSETEGEVTGEDVNIRRDATAGSEPLGSLAKGSSVRIMGEKMGWLKIEAPPSVRYYISKKYVEVVGPADKDAVPPEIDPVKNPTDGSKTPVKPAVDTPSSDKAAADKLAEVKRLIRAETEKMAKGGDMLKQADFRIPEAMLQEILATTKDAKVRSAAEDDLNRVRGLTVIVDDAKRVEETVKTMDDKIQSLTNPMKKTYDAVGWVEMTGALLHDRPGEFELKEGGKRVCFVKAAEGTEMYNALRRHYSARVGVRGSIVENPPGWSGEKLIVAEQVELIGQ